MNHLSLPVIVGLLAMALTSFSRVFDATKPLWGLAPAWLQVLFPTLLAASGLITSQLSGVKTPTDLVVAIVAGVVVILPGLPTHRSSAPLPRTVPKE